MPVFSKIALYPTPSPNAQLEPLRYQPLPKGPQTAKSPSEPVQGDRLGSAARESVATR